MKFPGRHHPHPPKMPHRRNFRSKSWTLALRMIFAFRNAHVSDASATPTALNRKENCSRCGCCGKIRGGRAHPTPWNSVRRPQDPHDLGVLHAVFPQQVIMPSILSGNVTQRERQIAVGIQTRRDPQRVRRKIAFVHILAFDMENPILGRCHVEAAITQREEIPIATCVPVSYTHLRAHET